MKWSWKLTRIAGIDIYVHVTFLVLILWIGVAHWRAEGSLGAVATGVGFILALFACVVLHEFGHALTARRFGIATRDITLLPIGGVAALERMPEDPKQEILVALAGPAVNVAIAALLWLWLSLAGAMTSAEPLSLTGGPFLERLLAINVMLAVFNMLPAFPMDGGRVLRAALALRMDRARATGMAARIGQALALWLGLMGLLYNPFLILIALFVWFGAAAEAGSEQVKSSLAGAAVGRAMLVDYQTMAPGDPLSRAVALTMAGSQKDFPVIEGGRMIGVLGQSDLLRGLQAAGESAPAGDWMQPQTDAAEIDEPLESVLARLQASPCRVLPVMRDGRLAGIVDLDNVMELIRIQTAIQDHRSHWPAGKETLP